jgi:hypothetical protein
VTTIVRLQLQQLADQLAEGFDSYQASEGPLPRFTPEYRECLIRQLVDSSRVNNYLEYLRTHSLSSAAADPSDPWFDPIKAAVIRHRQGDEDEAFWLVFLRTQFAKHRKAGWRYAREVYGALSSGEPWTWQRVVADLDGFRDWLDAHQAQLSDPSLPHGFGNHRKYESLAGWNDKGTGSVVASYVAWVGQPPEHRTRFGAALASAEGDPQVAFDVLYRSMTAVHRFGRLARFDYLSTIGKLGLAPVQPGKAYLQGSTGPLRGARLLFQVPGEPGLTTAALEDRAARLQTSLGVRFDVLEDALCNWQKSPAEFKPFRG